MVDYSIPSFGVVGATGAVGVEIIRVIYARRKELSKDGEVNLRLFGSVRSAGITVDTPFGDQCIETFDVEACASLDFVFLAVSGSFSQEYAHAIVERSGDRRTVVIDNSSAYRYDPAVPLVVPEINGAMAQGSRLVANPNCTTAIAVMALWPLHRRFGLKRVVMSTYQAASGAGAAGMRELEEGVKAHVEGRAHENSVFQHPLPFNCIPAVDTVQENGYTKEEMKVLWEMRKIFGYKTLEKSPKGGSDEEGLAVTCTAVRVPTLRAHAEAISIETELPISPSEARKVLATAPGVQLVDDPKENLYPMPINSSGEYDISVGRIRQSTAFGGGKGLEMFVCGDQLLRGAALNAVLIAEFLITHSSSGDGERQSASHRRWVPTHRHTVGIAVGFAVSAMAFFALIKKKR